MIHTLIKVFAISMLSFRKLDIARSQVNLIEGCMIFAILSIQVNVWEAI